MRCHNALVAGTVRGRSDPVCSLWERYLPRVDLSANEVSDGALCQRAIDLGDDDLSSAVWANAA